MESQRPELIKAWRCTGCQRIDAPQPCIGVCEDRAVLLVDASVYRATLERTRAAECRSEALRAFVAQLARLTPADGHCRETFEALQTRARRLLAQHRA